MGKIYLNELAPWERKREYYNNIKLENDIRKQTHAINNQTKALIVSQLASANSIIASQERISEGIGSLVDGLNSVELSIDDLKSTFEWGISEVVWQLEQNRVVLRNILEVLMAPLDNKAKERRKRAEEAYSNGWIDDAEEEFLISEKLNKFDFSIHISLGMIYLFSKINKAKALSYFEKAAKYARPKSSYYTSFSLLYVALIKFDLGEIQEAERYSQEAITISPDFLEAYYQNAQYNAQLKNHEKSTTYLEKLISQDILYCLKANKDALFDPIRPYVNQLYEKLKEQEKKIALKGYNELIQKQHKLNSFINEYSTKINLSSEEKNSHKINKNLSDLNSRINRNSFIDLNDVNNIYLPQLQDEQKLLYINIEENIKRIIYAAERKKTNLINDIEKAKYTHQSKVSEYLTETGNYILKGSFIVPAVMTLLVADGWYKLLTIVFCIPVISQIISLVMIYCLIFSEFSKKEEFFGKIVAWSIIIYIVLAIVYYFISVSNSKAKSNEKNLELSSSIKEEEIIKNKMLPILEKFKNI